MPEVARWQPPASFILGVFSRRAAYAKQCPEPDEDRDWQTL